MAAHAGSSVEQGSRAGGAVLAPSSSIERRLLGALLRWMGDPAVRVVLWDGESVGVGGASAVDTLHIKDRGTLLRLLYHPELEFGEAYVDGCVTVEGDLTRLLMRVYAAPANPLVSRLVLRAQRPRANSLSGSRSNIQHHYDLGNDFYRLWLDERLVYTCAHFSDATASLEAAQLDKMELVARKLLLRPGDRVVEAGCGWGSLALYLAQHHGVSVRAFNISHEQIRYARDLARQAGLGARVEFIEDDYRNVTGQYDAFVSVGMLEHVGRGHFRELGEVIDRCLPAHGRGLIHSIGRNRPLRLNAWIERHIFPGAYPPTLREMVAILEPHDFSVLDVENLRLHYAKTTASWLARFESHAARVAAMYDERFVRAWRLYLAGSTAAFTCGSLQLFQVAFARARFNELPWTRAHLYD